MKYMTGVAAALLCALPLSGAFAWGSKSSNNAEQMNGASTGYSTATDVHHQTQGSNDAGLTRPSSNDRTQSFSQEQRPNEYGAASSSDRAMNASGTVRNAQQALAQAGADVPQNGRLGPRTERAILNYQSLHHLPLTGRLDQRTLQSLNIS